MFQNMFPTINVTTTRLETCQRVLLLEYNAETDRILLRQYSIAVKAAGVAKNLKKLLDRRGDAAALHESLGKLTDISELMTKSGYGSESEGEDAEAGRVELADRGTRQSRIKLTEIGPRMELEVIKIEEGLCEGKVLYHRYEARTEEEVREKDDEMEAAKSSKLLDAPPCDNQEADEFSRLLREQVRTRPAPLPPPFTTLTPGSSPSCSPSTPHR